MIGPEDFQRRLDEVHAAAELERFERETRRRLNELLAAGVGGDEVLELARTSKALSEMRRTPPL